MRHALLVLCLLGQEDPFKTLADPARRAREADRRAALEALRPRAGGSVVHAVAARFLEKSDRQWRLVFDRIKTPAGTFAGAVEGATFVAFTGSRIPASSGTIEKDVRDAGAAELDPFLAKFWSSPPDTEQRHRDALAALLPALEKAARSEAGAEPFRLLALAHVAALGDRAGDAVGKLGFFREGDRWGTRPQLALLAIARGLAKPGYIPADVEKAARASSEFAPRYAAALLDVEKTFSANAGFEALAKALAAVAGTGAPRGAADHVKALAEGVRAAAQCGCCKAGKLPCDKCQGRKRLDIACPTCKGLGWSQKGEQANVLVRCVNCRGALVFRNAACPECKQTGTATCLVCAGKGWRDGFKGCRDCRICGSCHGRRLVETPCATCGGKGRVPPLVLGIPSILCGDCKGQAILKPPCTACAQTGLGDCATCGGKGLRDGKSPARPKAADVYGSDPCDACGGKGFPLASMAVPCERCLGLGVRIKPGADPSKTLE